MSTVQLTLKLEKKDNLESLVLQNIDDFVTYINDNNSKRPNVKALDSTYSENTIEVSTEMADINYRALWRVGENRLRLSYLGAEKLVGEEYVSCNQEDIPRELANFIDLMMAFEKLVSTGDTGQRIIDGNSYGGAVKRLSENYKGTITKLIDDKPPENQEFITSRWIPGYVQKILGTNYSHSNNIMIIDKT